VSDLTEGPQPAYPPIGVDRLYADTQGRIHHLHADGTDLILVDPSQGGVITSAMILDATIQAADLAAGVAAANVGALGGVLTGTLPSPGMAAGAAAANVGTLGVGLTGTLPNPQIATGAVGAAQMTAGAAASNVGALGNALSGFLPTPALASGVAIASPVISNPVINGNPTGSPAFSAWTTFSMGVSQGGASITTSTSYGAYLIVGKRVTVSGYLILTAVSGAVAGSTIIVTSLPFPPKTVGSYMTVGTFSYLRSGITVISGVCILAANPQITFNAFNGAGGAMMGASPSFAVAVNDQISFTIDYEAQ
jgi:hypothetical protein